MTGVEYNVNSQFSFLFSVSSLQIANIIRFCLLGHILGLEALRHFRLKDMTRKIDKIKKKIELYQVFMCQTVPIFPKIYIIYKKN